MNNKIEIQNIIVELTKGSFQSFEKLYKMYSGKLYHFIMNVSGGNQYMTEEIVQLTFIRLWEIRSQIDPNRSLISYLCTIAKNLLMNMYQHQTVEYIYQEYILKNNVDHENQTEENTDLNFLNDYIDTLMEELPPSRRKIFMLSKYRHYTNKEIASLMLISESTVATQLSLAVKFMRERLMKHYDKIFVFLFLLS